MPDVFRTMRKATRVPLMNFRPIAMAAMAIAALTASQANGQVPTKCLEIESILVDACVDLDACPGATEGKNEMVRFITGPAAIDIADLRFVFYSSTFRGIEQNGTTAALTAALNATIQSCGHLLEPPGGIIPPGSRVIFVTSTDMCVAANPFYALSDTLYLIFQKAGNSQGHFKNNDLVMQDTTSTPGPPIIRTLQINLPSISCGDTVAYDANQLVNIYGNYAGQSEENDGATVNFAWPGTPVPSYVNYGCQAPFEPTVVSVVSGGGMIDCGDQGALVGLVEGSYASLLWQGGGGTFGTPQDAVTTYTPGGGDNGDVELSFCAITQCGDTICTTVTVTTGATPNVTVTGDTTLCGQFDTSVLTATGGDSYVWNTGATGPVITADISGPLSYWVAGSNACGTDTAYIAPRWMHTTTYYTNVSCYGGADGVLMAHGTGGVWPYTYLWSNGSTDSVITGLEAGQYYSYTITDSDGCTMNGGTTLNQPNPLVLTVGGDTTICAGGTVTLTAEASGGTPGYYFTWSPEGPVVSPIATTTYSVELTDLNGCTAPPQEVTVYVGAAGPVAVTTTDLDGCAPHCITFTAEAGAEDAFHWEFGDGATATGSEVAHCYTVSDGFYATLTVQQANGCADLVETIGPIGIEDCGEEVVVPTDTLVVPNVFTPNGDGLNDVFRISGGGLTTLDVQIFNRWGQLVARLERVNQVWDGRSPVGEVLSEGTYFYILQAQDSMGKSYDLSGAVTLRR